MNDRLTEVRVEWYPGQVQWMEANGARALWIGDRWHAMRGDKTLTVGCATPQRCIERAIDEERDSKPPR